MKTVAEALFFAVGLVLAGGAAGHEDPVAMMWQGLIAVSLLGTAVYMIKKEH